ncbi:MULTISPECIES: caspase family protein [Nostocales]|uniref:Peptidase C14 caspase catalytic subunit p20 n=3 Tax=Nostocales TaxID=1161 RepID=A0A0C1N2Z2_9CYAN|nr:caspase family protein [Tolypothrix bouteillei]KAF3889829.1 peptidase C14 caspase catalytic subunit p20 [Tolypothrix bouteillei VB521301]
MAKSIYALLVGIDRYDPNSVSPVPSLQGCVNDIAAAQEYLEERTKDGEWQLIEPLILKNEQATREAIIQGFKDHLCKADSSDVVFFYYAGHGGQEKAPEEFWVLEPDRLNESLICYDSRTANGKDLADKELSYLISLVAKKDPHVLIVLDCCHSGSGTRDLAPDVKVRRASVDNRERDLKSYLFYEDQKALDEILTSSRNLDEQKKTTGVVLPPRGKHIMFSACRDYELAKEYKGDRGEPRGVFSYFLMQTLQRTNGKITYRDLARNINAIVSGKVKEQSPQVDATNPEELDQPFLGGAIGDRDVFFALTYNRNENGWLIDGGGLHGLRVSQETETLLAIFPLTANSEELRNLDAALGEAKVTKVFPQRSKVQITKGEEKLSEKESYKAVAIGLPLPPLKVYFKTDESDAVGIELARKTLQTSGLKNQPSLYVREVEQAADANYYLAANKNQYWILQREDLSPAIAPIPEASNGESYTSEMASALVTRLEHIARWKNVLDLSTPATSRIKPDDVEMSITIVSGKKESPSSSELRVEYTHDSNNNEWLGPVLQVRLTNRSFKTLYANVVLLSEDYAINADLFEEKSSIRLAPSDSGGSSSVESELTFYIPEAFLEQGITEYKDIFKLIVCTTEFNASLLQQDGLNPPPRNRSTEQYGGTLDRLLDGVHTRNAVRAQGTYDDWMTKEITVTLIKPQDAKPIKSHSSTSLQDGLVEVQPHPSLRAKVNLTTVPQASRDLGNLILPAILRQEPRVTQSFAFTSSRGSDPGLSAIELSDIEDYTVVNKDAPLTIVIDKEITENEYLLPFAYDSEDKFFLPLGRGIRTENGKTEIVLERLPKPSTTSRSLQGSVKIFLEKVAHQKLGRPYNYPLLSSVASIDDKDKVTYEANKETIKGQVAQAQKIVLFIHGILGSTQRSLSSINKAKVTVNGQDRTLKEHYDLVLAFDYENLQTTIEENAKLLGQRLQEIGLGPNHGKELHIVAHSMGGLIARWFIEQEGGNQVVQHLVMLGTPNAGSPWPSIQDWVFTALSFGLNQLSAVVWPTRIVAVLLELLENNDLSLEQMHPESEFFKAIALSEDPHVPYTIIAGDRSLISGISEEKSGQLHRLMQKLFGKAVDKAIDLAFFQQPNDLAVSLASITSVTSDRTPPPRILEPYTACDHVTYFTVPSGLAALSEALSPKH